MGLFVEALQREVDELHRNNVRLEFIGARQQLQAGLIDKISAAEEQTRDNNGLRLIVAVAYGGRWDIVKAIRKLAGNVAAGDITAEEIDDQAVAAELQLCGVPDPDLLIRTGGEQRISNFLLWNLAYAELWFCDTLWPDFGEQQFDEALAFYGRRQRRYGHTGDQVKAVRS
jgi:undecaprenyl diphosphate synthase